MIKFLHFFKHSWSNWSKPYKLKNAIYLVSFQDRKCKICNKIEERHV